MRRLHDWLVSYAPAPAGGDPHISVIKTPGLKSDSRRQQSPRKGIVMNVARTVNNWIAYRKAVTELGRLNSRALQDLGLTRDEIPAAVRAAIR